jgi:hypothetical protein
MRKLMAAQARHDNEVIVLDLPSIPLTPGTYELELQLKDGPQTIDYVRGIAFNVVAADVLGEGYRFDSQYGFFEGHFVVPWEWEIRPVVDEKPAPTPRKRARARQQLASK